MNQKKTFEEAMRELETIVKQIEDENTPLETILELYEKGSELSAYCQDILSRTKARLEIIRQSTEREGEEEK
ncbi:MAG: exodeoxyribonuclease VII small subunit [FCB group bacterium]|nr:exodeoxyribonuclease VII small subunit [FCB group bacterium]